MESLTFTLTAGAAIRGAAKRRILEICWNQGADVQVQEDKGFLSSLYRFTVRVTPEQLRHIQSQVQSLVAYIASI